VLIPVWVVLVLLFHPDFSAVTWQSFLLSIPTILLAYATSFLLGATVTSLAFWTTRVYSIHEFYFALITLFSGQFVPLQLMPPFIQGLAQYLPFQMFKYVPIQVLLNKLPASVILRDDLVGAAWFIIALFLFKWTWREGVKRFSAVGA
jgi:ABC-2 type transport system permease protein